MALPPKGTDMKAPPDLHPKPWDPLPQRGKRRVPAEKPTGPDTGRQNRADECPTAKMADPAPLALPHWGGS